MELKGTSKNLAPGKTFCGNHLWPATMSWKLAIPEMVEQLHLPYDAEYAMAEQLNSERA